METTLYPLLREHDSMIQPGAAELVQAANYLPLISRSILGSQIHFLRRRPRAYLRSIVDLVRDTAGGRPKILAAGLLFFPRSSTSPG